MTTPKRLTKQTETPPSELLKAAEVIAEAVFNADPSHALMQTFISPNECDRNMESANVVDGLFAIARAINRLADILKRPTGAGTQPPGV